MTSCTARSNLIELMADAVEVYVDRYVETDQPSLTNDALAELKEWRKIAADEDLDTPDELSDRISWFKRSLNNAEKKNAAAEHQLGILKKQLKVGLSLNDELTEEVSRLSAVVDDIKEILG